MFLILNSSKLIVDISPHVHYVRRQSNGVTVGCNREKADAIYSANTDQFYSLNGYSLAEVDNIPENILPGYYYYIDGKFPVNKERQEELRFMRVLNSQINDLIISALEE